jgi:hydroxymethylglutaryl-CoA reductase
MTDERRSGTEAVLFSRLLPALRLQIVGGVTSLETMNCAIEILEWKDRYTASRVLRTPLCLFEGENFLILCVTLKNIA